MVGAARLELATLCPKRCEFWLSTLIFNALISVCFPFAHDKSLVSGAKLGRAPETFCAPFPWRVRTSGGLLEIRVLVSIDPLQGFGRHAKISRRFVDRDAGLYQPGGCRMPQGVLHDVIARQPGALANKVP
jgi:hypothetical protein